MERGLTLVAVAALAAAACNGLTGPPPPPQPLTVAGSVADTDTGPVVGATVRGSIGGVTRVAVTDSIGHFELDNFMASSGQLVALDARLDGYVPTQLSAQLTFPITNVAIRLPRADALTVGRTTVGSISSADADAYVGAGPPSERLSNAKVYTFATPATDDVLVDLTYGSAGTVALQMWVEHTTLSSTGPIGHQTIVLPRGTTGTLLVGQPAPNSLTRPVPFALLPQLATSADVTATAGLEIVSFTLGDQEGPFTYFPDLALRETSGTNVATITSIEFRTSPDDKFPTVLARAGCLPNAVVLAGQTWTLADGVSYYCREVDESAALTMLYVTVRYIDPEGRTGSVSGQTDK